MTSLNKKYQFLLKFLQAKPFEELRKDYSLLGGLSPHRSKKNIIDQIIVLFESNHSLLPKYFEYYPQLKVNKYIYLKHLDNFNEKEQYDKFNSEKLSTNKKNKIAKQSKGLIELYDQIMLKYCKGYQQYIDPQQQSDNFDLQDNHQQQQEIKNSKKIKHFQFSENSPIILHKKYPQHLYNRNYLSETANYLSEKQQSQNIFEKMKSPEQILEHLKTKDINSFLQFLKLQIPSNKSRKFWFPKNSTKSLTHAVENIQFLKFYNLQKQNNNILQKYLLTDHFHLEKQEEKQRKYIYQIFYQHFIQCEEYYRQQFLILPVQKLINLLEEIEKSIIAPFSKQDYSLSLFYLKLLTILIKHKNSKQYFVAQKQHIPISQNQQNEHLYNLQQYVSKGIQKWVLINQNMKIYYSKDLDLLLQGLAQIDRIINYQGQKTPQNNNNTKYFLQELQDQIYMQGYQHIIEQIMNSFQMIFQDSILKTTNYWMRMQRIIVNLEEVLEVEDIAGSIVEVLFVKGVPQWESFVLKNEVKLSLIRLLGGKSQVLEQITSEMIGKILKDTYNAEISQILCVFKIFQNYHHLSQDPSINQQILLNFLLTNINLTNPNNPQHIQKIKHLLTTFTHKSIKNKIIQTRIIQIFQLF